MAFNGQSTMATTTAKLLVIVFNHSNNFTTVAATTLTLLNNTTNGTIYKQYNNSDVNSNREGKFTTFNPSPSEIIELVVLFFVCLMTLLGNSLVILAFIKGNRSIRTHTNYFVVNLAVCDFLVGCLSLPFWICVKLGKSGFKNYF